MIINFYPEHDDSDFEKAAKEYEMIWRKENKKILQSFNKISSLKFKEKEINALISNEIPYSTPLQLKAKATINEKRAILIHELCHRLLVGNEIKLKGIVNESNYSLIVHKLVDLILFDIWVDLYGKEFANAQVEIEKKVWNKNSLNPYTKAWDWALSMSHEERQKEFKKYLT